MAKEIFIDTAAWLALSDTHDQYHVVASQFYRSLYTQRPQLMTTNLVIGESFVLIRRAGNIQAALRFLDAIKQSANLTKIYSTNQLETEAEKILRKFHDQDFSFVDSVSFALMRERGIREAFTFDHHFQVAGFIRLPGNSR